jgi:DNA-binding transcriptional LysR family regulator
MQVRSLEEQVGLPLTEQIGKKIFLTSAGEELAFHARRLQQQLEDAQSSLDALKGVRGGRLVIGVVSTAKYFAPQLLAAFRLRHPDVELRIVVQNREKIVEQIEENRIDLAIMGRPPEEFETASAAFAEHPLVILAPPDHPFAERRRIDLSQLVEQTFIVREQGSGTRSAMERFFADQGFSPAHTLEMSSNETIKQAVMAGMGLAFLSAHTAQLECAIRRLIHLQVAGTPVLRQWFVVHRSDKRLLPPAIAFREFLCSEAARLIAGLGQEPARPAARAAGLRSSPAL